MATKRPKPEEIVAKLRRVEVLMGQGMPRIDAIRQIGVTEQTYSRWKIEASNSVGSREMLRVRRNGRRAA